MITENNVGEEENIKRNIETKKYRSEIKNSISKKKKSKYKNSDIYNSNFKKNKENNDKDNNILMIDKNSNDTKDSPSFTKYSPHFLVGTGRSVIRELIFVRYLFNLIFIFDKIIILKL